MLSCAIKIPRVDSINGLASPVSFHSIAELIATMIKGSNANTAISPIPVNFLSPSESAIFYHPDLISIPLP